MVDFDITNLGPRGRNGQFCNECCNLGDLGKCFGGGEVTQMNVNSWLHPALGYHFLLEIFFSIALTGI